MSVAYKILSMNSLTNVLKTNVPFRTISTTSSVFKKPVDRKTMLATVPAKDEGIWNSRYLKF